MLNLLHLVGGLDYVNDPKYASELPDYKELVYEAGIRLIVLCAYHPDVKMVRYLISRFFASFSSTICFYVEYVITSSPVTIRLSTAQRPDNLSLCDCYAVSLYGVTQMLPRPN